MKVRRLTQPTRAIGPVASVGKIQGLRFRLALQQLARWVPPAPSSSSFSTTNPYSSATGPSSSAADPSS